VKCGPLKVPDEGGNMREQALSNGAKCDGEGRKGWIREAAKGIFIEVDGLLEELYASDGLENPNGVQYGRFDGNLSIDCFHRREPRCR
jgi:hypothetical protein